MVWSTLSWRSAMSFSWMNTCAWLVPRPPVKPATVETSGSASTTFDTSTSFCCMFWNEMLCSPSMVPISRPLSCDGKKVLGIRATSSTVSTMVSGSVSTTSRRWRSATSRLDW